MRAASLVLCVLVCTIQSWAVDRSTELTKELASPWDSVIVSMMIDQGCVAPFYVGVRFRSIRGDYTINNWKKKGKEEEGVAQPLKSSAREEFCADVLKHYKAGVASEDIHEHIAALSTEEQQEKKGDLATKEAKKMSIGGFGALGIDIRIVKDGRVSHFQQNYGSTGWDAFQRWISEISPQTKD